MATGNAADLAAMIAADPECHLSPQHYDFYVCPDVIGLHGLRPPVGDGTATGFVNTVAGIPLPPNLWLKGPRLPPAAPKMPQGTVIAYKDIYDSLNPSCHIGVVTQAPTATSCRMQEQRAGLPMSQRLVLKFLDLDDEMYNNPNQFGTKYYVVLTHKYIMINSATNWPGGLTYRGTARRA